MTYPLLVTAEVARVEILGITEHAWADCGRRDFERGRQEETMKENTKNETLTGGSTGSAGRGG